MGMKSIEPSARHLEFRDGAIALLRQFEDLPAVELLALASHMVGQLVALQDQTKYTAAQLMDLVGENIEAGNAEAIASSFGGPMAGSA